MVKVGSQIMVRSQQRENVVVRMGNVVKIKGKTATVYFPREGVRSDLPLSRLESIEKRFSGVSRTQVNPIRRG